MEVSARLLIILLFLIFSSGCFDSNSNSSTTKTGVFIDSAVEGLEYQTTNNRGITDSNGHFDYQEGDSVQFFLGDIQLGDATIAKAVITPFDLSGGLSDSSIDPAVNIARFLQKLDGDNHLVNGITINPLVRQMAVGKYISFDMSVDDFEKNTLHQAFLTELSVVIPGYTDDLTPLEDATFHLRNTLANYLKDLETEIGGIVADSPCTTDNECSLAQLRRGCSNRLIPYSINMTDVNALNEAIDSFSRLSAYTKSLLDFGNSGFECPVVAPQAENAACVAARCQQIIDSPQPTDCGISLDQATIDSLYITGDSEVGLKPGESVTLRLARFECCVFDRVVDACTQWSIEPQGWATIDSLGVLMIDPAATAGSKIMVSGNIENGVRIVKKSIYIYTEEDSPLVGNWIEEAQLLCTDGSDYVPEILMGSLVFRADGTFNATWTPFEVYKDYWGDYSTDVVSGKLILDASGGNYIPPDIDGSGASIIDDQGRLVLKDIWLGSHRSGPELIACGHRFIRQNVFDTPILE